MVAQSANFATPLSATLTERLFSYARSQPLHDAIVTPAVTYSYGQLAELVARQATQLAADGLDTDSVAGISCADDVGHLLLCLAVAHRGGTSITLPTHDDQIARDTLIHSAGVTHVVDQDALIDLPATGTAPGHAHSKLDPAANAGLLFATSGTTGTPKLVLHDTTDIVAQAHRHIISRDERFACLATMEHNFARRHRLYCVAEGATNVFPGADLAALAERCRALNVSTIHVSAFQARELLALPDKAALEGIRLKLGGSHVTTAQRRQLRTELTRNLQAGYGTTETGAIAFTDPDDVRAGESVGRPLPGIEIRIVAEDGKPARGRGEHGEIAVRCTGMFREYRGQPELTAARLRDGWFYTGDIGYLDSEQRIYLSGRADDMFVFNSMNIYPQDIESIICQYPDVADAAVLPKASRVHGDIPVALVAFSDHAPKARLRKLQKFVRDQVGLRCPRQFIVVDEIPRNAAGKIARSAALALASQSDQIRRVIADALDERAVAHLPPALLDDFARGETDITLRELQLDSLARMELLVALELQFDAIIEPREYNNLGSLAKIAGRVYSRLHEAGHESADQPPVTAAPVVAMGEPPYAVRFFQRTFSYCQTVAQLNKALVTLEHRLTPVDIDALHTWHQSGLLLPDGTVRKFHTALTDWLTRVRRMMADSGKTTPEPFVAHRAAPTAMWFRGPGEPADKSLVICFAVKGGRSLMIPNAVLMQHTDASRYDLLVIAEPLDDRYQSGVPMLGDSVGGVVAWLAEQSFVKAYGSIRTIGSSAGGYPAILAAFVLNAELAVSVAGRFHSLRFPGQILRRAFSIWRVARRNNKTRVLLTYGRQKTRDRNFARIAGALARGTHFAIDIDGEKLGHKVLERLGERHEIKAFLDSTLYTDTTDDVVAQQGSQWVFGLPAGALKRID
ncbi:MAG: AMP-binding protein [Gammaproteobacteria bacterium]|nr:AMP-binding protein [Gammaproteobacteria bacterium]